MQEFLLLIHRDLTSANPKPSAEQMKEATKPYQEWIAGIAAQDKLVAPPKRWDIKGRIVKQHSAETVVAEGPFAEKKESVGGVVLIRSKDYDEAVAIAQGCPIIQYGAIVEVRMATPVA